MMILKLIKLSSECPVQPSILMKIYFIFALEPQYANHDIVRKQTPIRLPIPNYHLWQNEASQNHPYDDWAQCHTLSFLIK